MKQLFFILTLIPFLSYSQTFNWVTRSGPGPGHDFVTEVISDSVGNTFIKGSFQNSMTLGQNTYTHSAGIGNFVVKYDPSGNIQWVVTGKAPTSVYFSSITQDEFSNIYFVAVTQASVLTIGSTTISAGAGHNILCRLDKNGSLVWMKDFVKGPLAYSPELYYNNGSIYMHSAFGATGTVVIGSNSFKPAGNTDFLIARFDTLGNPLWSHAFGGTQSETATGIAVSPSHDVFICGQVLSPSLVMGTTTLTGHANLPQTAGSAYLAKFDQNGNLQWAKTNNSGDIMHPKIVVDHSGNLFFGGTFFDTLQMGSQTLITNMADVFLFALDNNGDPVWKLQTHSSDAAFLNDLACDAYGNTFLCGSAGYGSLSLGTFSAVNNTPNTENSYIAAVNNQGNPAFLLSSGGNGVDGATAITNDPKGNLYVAGLFAASAITGTNSFPSGTTTLGAYTFTAPYNSSYFYFGKIGGLTVGLKEQNKPGHSMAVFPNPSTREFNVVCKESVILEIEVSDMNGKLILNQKNLHTSDCLFDLSQHNPGIYMLKVRTANGIYTRKINRE